jgi:hypothetical protein
MKNPIQPFVMVDGVLRFKENAIVRHLLDKGGISLNDIAILDFSKDDRQQFAQLIGYSLSGYGDLRSYVTDDAYNAAEAMSKGRLTEDQARIKTLERELKAIRKGLAKPVARLFGIHPDDLTENMEDQ